MHYILLVWTFKNHTVSHHSEIVWLQTTNCIQTFPKKDCCTTTLVNDDLFSFGNPQQFPAHDLFALQHSEQHLDQTV